MQVLLVDSSKKSKFSKYVPLALLKLAALHKSKGDSVTFVKAGSAPRKKFDVIYFSTIFLFNLKKDIGYIRTYAKHYPKAVIKVGGISVSLLTDKFKSNINYSNVEYVTGLVPELDSQIPDYSLAGLDFSYGFTSRGCPNRCAWCVVPKIEGKQYIVKDWKKAINTEFKVFKGMDNNILSCDVDHIKEVFEYLTYHNIQLDFNQGMDCQLLMKNERLQKLFIEHKRIWQYIRFAWDSKRCDKYAIQTLDFFNKHKIIASGDFLWYMLYDFTDSPEVVFDRVKNILKHKHDSKIKLMRYKDLTTGNYTRYWGDVGDIWTDIFKCGNATGILSRNKIDRYMFEKDIDTFYKRVPAIKEIYNKYGTAGIRKFRESVINKGVN